MKKKTRVLILVGMAALSIYAYMSHTKNPIKNTKWSCSGGKCKVTFMLKNPYNYPTSNRIVIRAHRRETHDQKVGGAGYRMVGETYIDIDLETGESKELVEILILNAKTRVDMLVAKNIHTARKGS